MLYIIKVKYIIPRRIAPFIDNATCHETFATFAKVLRTFAQKNPQKHNLAPRKPKSYILGGGVFHNPVFFSKIALNGWFFNQGVANEL